MELRNTESVAAPVDDPRVLLRGGSHRHRECVPAPLCAALPPAKMADTTGWLPPTWPPTRARYSDRRCSTAKAVLTYITARDFSSPHPPPTDQTKPLAYVTNRLETTDVPLVRRQLGRPHPSACNSDWMGIEKVRDLVTVAFTTATHPIVAFTTVGQPTQ